MRLLDITKNRKQPKCQKGNKCSQQGFMMLLCTGCAHVCARSGTRPGSSDPHNQL
jgi:hypothetical protein